MRTPALDLSDQDVRSLFPDELLDRIESYRSLTRWLWVAGTAVELGVLATLAWKGRALARLVRRALGLPERARVRLGVAVAIVVSVSVWIALLPIGAVRHWWARRYGVSEQGYAAWLGDQALSLLVTTVILAAVVAIAVLLSVRLGRRWWIPAGAALAAVGAVVVLVQPLVIEPLFHRVSPLADRALAAEIEAIGTRLGVRVDGVEVADASRRTTAANAKVLGIGPSGTVVLYDTLLDGRFGRQEVEWIAAHELAHVARGHVWRAVAWFALFAFAGAALLGLAFARRGGLRDPALVPLALLLAFVFWIATLPAQNAISKRYETEADWLALQATGDPASDVALQRRLVATGLTDPDPPGWVSVVLGSHPTPLDRIAMAEAFRARAGS